MRFTRARFITVCQQMLVTAVVAAVGLSAAGVLTLEIVSPEAPATAGIDLTPAITGPQGYAAKEPVTSTVREVAVTAPSTQPTTAKDRVSAKKSAPASASSAARKVAVVSEPTPVQGYATVGVTWQPGTDLSEDDIAVQVRTKTDGQWSEWTPAEYHDEHGPDAGTAEADQATRPGTDAVVIGDVDEVQMRAETVDGAAPADLKLAVIDPGAGEVVEEPADIDTAKLPATDPAAAIESGAGLGETSDAAALGDGAAADLDPVAMKLSPKPTIYSRAQWGANEKLRDKGSLRYGTVKAGFIHHTVNANNYSAAQVPALMRGIYAYHTQSRGWSDIGYNFLVDRFGRIWEGRYGGVDRAVVGAHTLGFNEYAFAMSAIGNFDITQPPQAVLDAYASLFAWKLSLNDIRADATRLYVKNRYLPAINGHRDVGSTACPGKYLYAKLGTIRAAAQAIQNKSQVAPDPVDRPMIAAPKGLTAPTAAAAKASTQPNLVLPSVRNLAGSGWADLVVKSTDGAIQVVPTEGILGYDGRIVDNGYWRAMSIIAAVGDVTGDGKSDVIAKSRKSGQSWIYRTDGKGKILRPRINKTSAFKQVKSIFGVRDFNRDGKNDVMGIQKGTGSLLLFPGTGKGTFETPVVLRKKWRFTRTVGVGDFNGDKQPDLVAVAGGRWLVLLPGAKRGAAVSRATRLSTLSAPPTAVLGWGDLSLDGKPDLVVRDKGTAQSRILTGDGSGKLSTVYGPFRYLAGLSKVSMAPMTGSSAADVVGRNPRGQLVIVPNNGRRNISAPLPTNLTVPEASQVLSVGDWNLDGHGDVMVRISGGDQLVLYPGLGNGKFLRARSMGTGWKAVTRLAAVGDVTGDGRPDLMGQIGTGALRIFPGNRLKAFLPPVLAPASLRTFNQIGRAAWSSRGEAFISSDGSFVPSIGSGLGTALRASNSAPDPEYDTYVGVGDVNGDGAADLLAREKGTGVIWLLPGKTSGGFAPRMWVASGFAGYQLIG